MKRFPITLAIALATPLAGMTATRAQTQAQVLKPWNAAPLAVQYATPDEVFRVEASIGAMYLRADEKVMVGDYTLSHLIWESTAPVLRGSMAIDVGSGFSIRAEGAAAAYGKSYMEDYDWLKGDDTFDNWSHRSQHPDTSLDYYYSGGASLAYELVSDETATVRVHGGFKYTDVQWSARGGSYLYSSTGGFRDIPGSIPDGAAAITYRQQLPEVFVGVDGDEQYGSVRVGGLLRGGMTFLSRATDDHWRTGVRFTDDLYLAPTVTAGADVGFALSTNAELTIAARYDHVFEHRGDTTYSGAETGTAYDAAAAALRSVTLTTGLQGSF